MKRIVLSDGNRTNSKGFKVDLLGISFDRFNTNPVMLYNHNQDNVVGLWENWSIVNNKLEADPKFDADGQLGGEVKRQYENGFLRAASIGLIVQEVEMQGDDLVVTKSEIFEASIVSVPADAGAVVLYNENEEVLSLEQLQLNFNNIQNQTKNQSKMVQITLSQKTAEMLGLASDHTAKDVELEVLALTNKVADLTKKLTDQETKLQLDYLDGAVKAGKITEVEKLSFVKLSANGGFESVKAIIDAKTESASASLADQVQKTTLSADRLDWTHADWCKKDSKGLAKLKLENPAEYDRIKETIKNK